jgi:hypothetical protein
MTGRDPGYMPEGTEDWMGEDGVPRAYDRAPIAHTYDLPTVDEARELLDRTGKAMEAQEKAKEGLRAWATGEQEARIKTLEATVTDMMRRLKALEERVIDPSV